MAESLPYLSGSEIRDKFLKFYESKQHKILPSASLISEDPTVILTIAGMLPFKPIFLGQQKAPQPRATTSQKCIRTNDIENVGRTARHHTFFEMLGNFSFGDYFKEQAIEWAWELSTQVYQLPPERIVVSVFQDDNEAFAIWRDKIGIPAHRIQRLGEEDNYWTMGATGPCGPCSELYYDFHPELGDENIDLEDDSRFIEFYNLVFMQYNQDAERNRTPLENKNIDTGLGLERMAQILQQVPNNYETDLIFPIIKTAAEIAGIDYSKADEKTKTSLKVIGDHVRSVVHMIADGISASNVGRGYILRRLIRRVVRHGRLIGIDGNFINKVAETAITLSESAYPAIREREEFIKNQLQSEESQFLKTLERGEKLLAEIINRVGTFRAMRSESFRETSLQRISGVDAFKLYDTYGFPLELTQEIAEEQGLTVDVEGFEVEMKKQRGRGRDSHETIDLTVQGSIDKLAEHIHPTEFSGYTELQATAKIEAVLVEGKTVETAEVGTEIQLILDSTPFYAESGGQIGDKGYLSGDNLLIRITDVQKESGFFVHYGKIVPQSGSLRDRGTVKVGDTVNATIDRASRRRVQANHTATHLLQAALKKIVDDSVSQAGSLVECDRLRFDFNSPRALTPDEVKQVEKLVNTWISEAHEADVNIMPIEEAKAKGATAMFGEKYGDEVRVIDFSGVSMELCGGTHVHNTAEIGAFKIISETGISSGVRRIEAVAGAAILDYLEVRDKVVKELSDKFKVKPEEVSERVNNLQAELKATQKELEVIKQELAVAKSDGLLSQAETVGDFKLLVANMGEMDAKSLQSAGERLQQKLGESAVVLASIPRGGKVILVAAFSQKVIKEKKLQAGKFIGGIAKICGGGGGGRPNLAQAGGRDASKLEEALETAKKQLIEGLS
ncbi:Alanine--tRNA ligase [Hyella patelloides LEGE 07179]|uniref:Alanine--tRNA ligase n=1 Tax=Hyella patelloides LEGE 07179 TaxID=945734 RepID=A0A563VWV1_9CYAN|nr:alanine--tRNA ligase [Hyella patelloides]VEP15733.1 Alanine--tRNA ligase [Hyella patelloides LEGE 07179]